MRKQLLVILYILATFPLWAQNPGDTIFVNSFNYTQTYGTNQWSAGIRDSMISFPTDTTLSFEKILMYYNIRCKDGLVSPGISGQTDIGCGEWDISCNTYITDSSRVDELLSFSNNYWISNFTGSSFDYVSYPTNDYYRYLQKQVTVNSTTSESVNTVGAGSLAIMTPIPSAATNAKSQYIFTKTELLAAGVVAGNLDGLQLQVTNGNAEARFMRISIKHTTGTTISDSMPHLSGFTEVYFKNTTFAAGSNRLQFYTPFVWDGTSNIIVEFNFGNSQPTAPIQFAGSATTFNAAIQSADDHSFLFDGANYIEANSYKGIPGSESRTIEAWIKTNVIGKEIASWGTNNTGTKWIFRTNSNGGVRVEVNGGYIFGSTNVIDNEWHHVACVMSGNNVNSISLYVDGVLEVSPTVSNITINTDTANGINFVMSQGFHNRFFSGNIDEIRVWKTALSAATLQRYRFAKVDNTHPNYSNLELYYKLDENQGNTIHDYSGNGNHGHVVNNSLWTSMKGADLSKSFTTSQHRPNIGFVQGTYNLTVVNDTVLDTIPRQGHSVKAYQIVDRSGSMYSDEVLTIMDTIFWASGFEYVMDPISNLIIDTIMVGADGTLNITELTYMRRSPMKYEIMSFVTPYGINLDLGSAGKTWTFDVSDFGPILRGNKRMTVERGGQWMEDMDIRFAFIVGTPPKPVLDITQLWKVDSKGYVDIMADRVYENRDVMMNANGKSFKIRSAISGHGQEGEFIPRNHLININGGSEEFNWTVWKTCSDNPIYPQGGTWIYSRAGWCPGAATDVKEMDITSYVTPGQISNIDYSVASASGTSNYIVNNQLVTYGDPNFSLDAAVIDITGPTNKVEYARENAICTMPGVVIQNTGTTTLSSLKIKYWVNNNPTPNTFDWTGSLAFLEKLEVSIPADSALWSSISSGKNTFHVQIQNPNGGTDEYAPNNVYHTGFEVPEVVPSDFFVFLRTNSAPQETSYKLYDDSGNTLFHKQNLQSNTFYRDTFQLARGCYKLEVLDSGGDGLKFFANSDGNGFIQINGLYNNYVYSFNPDFGSSTVLNFTIDFPLTYEEIHRDIKSVVFPNPSNGLFHVTMEGQQAQQLMVTDVMGRVVMQQQLANGIEQYDLDLRDNAPGIYVLTLQFANHSEQHKIVVQ